MPAAFVQSGKVYQGKGTTAVVTLGAAPTEGNVLVALVSEINTALLTSLSAGSGKNFTAAATPANTGIQLYALYRIADGTESATITATFSGNIAAHLWVAEFSGVDLYQSAVTNTGSGSAITGGTDGDSSTVLDVLCVADNDTSAAFTGATPSGYTLDDQASGGPSFVATYGLNRGDSNNPGTTGVSNLNWAAAHMTFAAEDAAQILRRRGR